MAEIVR